MATKKKTDVVEEVKEVIEAPVAEAPKKTTKKSTKKKAEPVEEVPAEEPKAEEAPIVEVKEEPKAEPVKEEKVEELKVEFGNGIIKFPPKEAPKAEGSFLVQVVSPAGIYTFKNPGIDQPKGKVFAKGTKLEVSEVKGNWGKVGDDMWILLSGAVAKI